MNLGDLKSAVPTKEELAEQAKAKALEMGQDKLNQQIGADLVNTKNIEAAKNMKGKASGFFGKMKVKMPNLKKPKMPAAPSMPKVPDASNIGQMPEMP